MPEVGEYIAIDLDENNRHSIEEWCKRFPDREHQPFGWGVCHHGHGLQDLPALSETQARTLAENLNGVRDAYATFSGSRVGFSTPA